MSLQTTSLVYLDYTGSALILSSYPFSHLDSLILSRYPPSHLDSLIEAKLDLRPSVSTLYGYPIHRCPIINCVRIVKTLSLSSASVKEMYSTGMDTPFFLNLVKLYFESDTKQGWEVMLPRLLNQSPKLETLGPKVLEIYGFSGKYGELKLVKSFLWQMQFLQVMKVRIDADNDNMKLQLINHLLALRKRHSFKCQIRFL